MSTLRFTGPLSTLTERERAVLLDRSFSCDDGLSREVAQLIAQVRSRGDAALVEFAARFNRVDLKSLEVPREERVRALAALDPAVRRGLERAGRNLECVARATLPAPVEIEVEPGVFVGRRAEALARVGVYAPGGTAAYPSSVLMGVVPARIAGVRDIVVCSPPGATGLPSDVVLAAAELAGATQVFALGGAGAIAALAWGTQSITRVDRIVGPGNAWVAEAKRQVSLDVGIDSPAGPSEILIIADERAPAETVARELLAQAEHDADACCVALTTSTELAARIVAALEALLSKQPRRETITKALRTRGAVLTVSTLDEAVEFANHFAAEHLLLALAKPDGLLARCRNAGTIFVGDAASVAFGDYVTGANHVLPTAGAARRCSGLSVLDFVRWTTSQRVTPGAAAAFSRDVSTLARAEGLYAHADAAEAWAKSEPGDEPALPLPPLRPTLATIARYQPTRPPCEIDLTDNTNLFGVPPGVSRLLKDAPPAAVTRYPSPWADSLRLALSREAGVAPECIATGCGSDDVIDAALRAFAEPGERLAWCPPTFGIIPTFARANGLEPVATALDVGALAASNARIIYLCAPNNPTGAVLPVGFVERLLTRTRAVVLLDEAYADFMSVSSMVRDAAQSERLVVLRTMSKAFGLAGLRVGWAVSNPRLITELEKTRGPYKVGGLAERAAVTALTDDRDWVRQCVSSTLELRARFAAELRQRGFTPLHSEANFLLVPVARSADEVATRMREHGVSVRAFPKLAGIGEAVRITIGPWEQLATCLTALVEATS